MKNVKTLLSLALVAGLGASALTAQDMMGGNAPAESCCGPAAQGADAGTPATGALVGNHAFLVSFVTGSQALAADDFAGAQASFKKWAADLAGAKGLKATVAADMKKAADALVASKDLAGMRKALNAASKLAIQYAAETGLDKKGVHFFYCPMAKGNWVGLTSDVKNPYYGKSMLSCGMEVPSAK